MMPVFADGPKDLAWAGLTWKRWVGRKKAWLKVHLHRNESVRGGGRIGRREG